MLDQQVARTFPTGPYVVTDRSEDLPTGHHGLVYGDPAWRFKTRDNATAVTARGRKVHYKTQTLEEIAADPVSSIAARDCILILWILGCLLPESLELIKHWGFMFKAWGPIRGKTTMPHAGSTGAGNSHPGNGYLSARGPPPRRSAVR